MPRNCIRNRPLRLHKAPKNTFLRLKEIRLNLRSVSDTLKREEQSRIRESNRFISERSKLSDLENILSNSNVNDTATRYHKARMK